MIDRIFKSKVVVIKGVAQLQAGNRAWAREHGDVNGLSVVCVLRVLRRIGTEQMCPTVPNFSHVVQSKHAGRNLAVRRDAHLLQWQKASMVVERVHKTPTDSSL